MNLSGYAYYRHTVKKRELQESGEYRQKTRGTQKCFFNVFNIFDKYFEAFRFVQQDFLISKCLN